MGKLHALFLFLIAFSIVQNQCYILKFSLLYLLKAFGKSWVREDVRERVLKVLYSGFKTQNGSLELDPLSFHSSIIRFYSQPLCYIDGLPCEIKLVIICKCASGIESRAAKKEN